jgi:hypothetical protein
MYVYYFIILLSKADLSSSVPPFGADENPELMSIFEVEHLRNTAVFLNTQCMNCFLSILLNINSFIDRMPPEIGDFISKSVYDGKLLSDDLHPIQPGGPPACRFIDVHGMESRGKGSDSIQVYVISSINLSNIDQINPIEQV